MLELGLTQDLTEFLESLAEDGGVTVDEVVQAIVMSFREQSEDMQRQVLHWIPEHRDHAITPDIYRQARAIVAANRDPRLVEAHEVLKRCPERVREEVEAGGA